MVGQLPILLVMKMASWVLALVGLLGSATAAQPPLWLVIGDEAFAPEMERLATYRKQQGLEVAVRVGPSVAEALTKVSRQPNYIVLVGDDLVGEGKAPARALTAKRRSLYRWRATQAETFASDSVFGDFDEDGIPEVPVGRIPARSPEQLALVIDKILSFEQKAISLADLSMPVWAGNPNYGDAFQANMASNLLRQTLQTEAPRWADLWLMMGSASDPLAGVPGAQADWFNSRVAKGGAIVGMMGHGGVDAFYSMLHAGQWITYNTGSVPAVKPETSSSLSPAPPTVLFTCDCGNFAHDKVSLGEAMLFSPSGPVAAIGATTESHPLPNYYSSVSLLRTLSAGKNRLGDLWIETQREGYGMRNALVEMFLKDVEGKLEAKLDTPRIRRDHLQLYTLLGDPATKLRLPQKLDMTWENADNRGRWNIPNVEGAKGLEIGYRAMIGNLTPRMKPVSDAKAREEFDEANDRLRYKSVKTFGPDEVWSGTFEEAGSYRFVVHLDVGLACAAQLLKRDD